MSTRESQGFQEFADRTGKLTLRGFPGWWVGVGPYLIHPLHPELSHQDLQGGHEWDGQEDPHDAEERAHHQDGEDYQGGMQVDGPAHYDRLEEIAFDLLNDEEGQNYPDDREGVRDQGQNHGNHDRDERTHVGDKRDKTAEDTEEQSERHPDQGERDGPENGDKGHGRELAEEPPLFRLVQCLKHLSRPLPPSRREERDEPVDPGFGPDDQVDGGDEHHHRKRYHGRCGQAHPRGGRHGAPRKDLSPDPGEALGIEADLGTKTEE